MRFVSLQALLIMHYVYLCYYKFHMKTGGLIWEAEGLHIFGFRITYVCRVSQTLFLFQHFIVYFF